MATHSSALAWRIPGTGKPDGVAQSRTQLKLLTSSSRVQQVTYILIYYVLVAWIIKKKKGGGKVSVRGKRGRG